MKLKFIKTFIAATVLGLSSLFITPAYAIPEACEGIDPSSPVYQSAGCGQSNDETKTEFEGLIVNILNGIIAVLGLVAVIYIIIGGVNYMTSSGDPNKTQKAKNTILYALIGLIICVLSFAIVNFAIVKIIG